ncbi:MAG: hypothetical protein M1832_000413 [Thelocarpon impressellum]|nr:MAG: hypothetical protein M1832_000413 [Thelocarpon impressellum]
MPRPKREGAPEPKKRSRNGCWPCKSRKVKCGEERPGCVNCERQGEGCDYSIRLNWDGRASRRADAADAGPGHSHAIAVGPSEQDRPSAQTSSVELEPAGDSIMVDRNADERGLTPRTPGRGLLYSPDSGQYPTPSDSNADSPGAERERVTLAGAQSSRASPSYQQTTFPASPLSTLDIPGRPSQGAVSLEHRHKRVRLNPDGKLSPLAAKVSMPPPSGLLSATPAARTQPQLAPYSPGNAAISTSITPPASSKTSDESLQTTPRSTPELRRLSVNPLLAGSATDQQHSIGSQSRAVQSVSSYLQAIAVDDADGSVAYGLDCGLPDLDIKLNDDRNAVKPITRISSISPTSHHDGDGDERSSSTALQRRERTAPFESGKYYARPVTIKIPQSLQPLPSMLLDHPMNLLYFHHFLDHTARLLLPHECRQNPFGVILPRMALEDDNLLSLLLAYSASHRARLLRQAEPVNRIALWVRDVFPALRRALGHERRADVSDANIATAVMLASLEIISPNTFEVAVPWQSHVDTARQMVMARGGLGYVRSRERVPSFLAKWFAYLDILGALSACGPGDWRFDAGLWANHGTDERDYDIDCLQGFTGRCAGMLAQVAALARRCHDGRLGAGWEPPADVAAAATRLLADMDAARRHQHRACAHRRQDSENEHGWDTVEMASMNEAFHWAGAIHLQRRVLGRPSAHAAVQGAVREIVGALFKVRKGGTAEANMLFPMFTAGCEATEAGQRANILERVRSVEHFGLTQVHRARLLLERVWETGAPWETLVAGEFFG